MKNQYLPFLILSFTLLLTGMVLPQSKGQTTYILDNINNQIILFDAKTRTIQGKIEALYPEEVWSVFGVLPSNEYLVALYGDDYSYGVDRIDLRTQEVENVFLFQEGKLVGPLFIAGEDLGFVITEGMEGYALEDFPINSDRMGLSVLLSSASQPEVVLNNSNQEFYVLANESEEIQVISFSDLSELNENGMPLDFTPPALDAFLNSDDPNKVGKLMMGPEEDFLYVFTLLQDKAHLFAIQIMDNNGDIEYDASEKASWTIPAGQEIQDFKISIDNKKAYLLSNSAGGNEGIVYTIDLVNQTTVSEASFPGLQLDGILLDLVDANKAFLIDKELGSLLPIKMGTEVSLDQASEVRISYPNAYSYIDFFTGQQVTSTAATPPIERAAAQNIGLIATSATWRDETIGNSYPRTSAITGFNSESHQLFQSNPLKGTPGGMAVNPNTNEIYVYNLNANALEILDASDLEEKETVDLETGDAALKLLGLNAQQNRLFFLKPDPYGYIPQLLILDWDATNPQANTTPEAFDLPPYHEVQFDEAGKYLFLIPIEYMTNPEVLVYDISDAFVGFDPPLKTIAVADTDFGLPAGSGIQIKGIALNPDGEKLYVWDEYSGLVRYNLSDGAFDQAIPGVANLKDIVFSKDGQQIFALDPYELVIIDVGSGADPVYVYLEPEWGLNTLELSQDGNSVYMYDKVEPFVDELEASYSMEQYPDNSTVYVYDIQEKAISKQFYPGANVLDLVLPVFEEAIVSEGVPVPTPMAINDPGLAYIPYSGSDLIAVIDLRFEQALTLIPLPENSAPIGVAVDTSRQYVFVSSSTKKEVYVINAFTNQLIQTITTSEQPISLDVSPSTGELLVLTDTGSESGKIERFSADDFAPNGVIAVAGKPGKLSATYNKFTCVTDIDQAEATVLVYKDNSTTPKELKIGKKPQGIEISPDSELALVYHLDAAGEQHQISVIQLSGSPSIVNTLSSSQPVKSIAFNNAGDKVYFLAEKDRTAYLDAADLLSSEVSLPFSTTNNFMTYGNVNYFDIGISPDDQKVVITSNQRTSFFDTNKQIYFKDESKLIVSSKPREIGIIPSKFEMDAEPQALKAYIPVIQYNTYKGIAIVNLDQSKVENMIGLYKGSGTKAVLTAEPARLVINTDPITIVDLKEKRIGFWGTGQSKKYRDFTISKDGKNIYGHNYNSYTVEIKSTSDYYDSYPRTFNLSKVLSESLVVSPDEAVICGIYKATNTSYDFFMQRIATSQKITFKQDQLGANPKKVSYHPDGKRVFVLLSNGDLKIFDSSSFEEVGSITNGNLDSYTPFTFSPTGESLYFTTADKLYSLDISGDLNLDLAASPGLMKAIGALPGMVYGLQVAPDNQKIYYYFKENDTKLRSMDLSNGTVLEEIELGAQPFIQSDYFILFPNN